MSSSAVGEGASCRVNPIPGSWFGFLAYANQAFRPSGVGDLAAVSSGNEKTLTFPPAENSLYRANTHTNCLHDIPWKWNTVTAVISMYCIF